LWVKFGLADADGMPAFFGASIATDPRTKRDQRWGGCRRIGMSGSAHRSGNGVAHDQDQPGLLEARDTRNLLSPAAKSDILDVPGAASDLVARMALERQTR